MIRVLLVLIMLAGATAAHAADVTGSPRVVDGDTLVIGDTRIRLEGIDAPETDQVCLDAKGERWTCGITARNRLASHISAREVSCTDKGHDRYGRTLAVCSASGEDLNAWMVAGGLALAYVHYSHEYELQEAAARENRRGMWIGAFIAPWDWRHRDKQTLILGALSVPITAQSKLLTPASAEGAPSPECTIKGNVNRNGERIYHIPGQRNYGSIDMTKPEKRWFCSGDEAQSAGWRKAH
jgi:endonuclease YncB( thermonuclease family)